MPKIGADGGLTWKAKPVPAVITGEPTLEQVYDYYELSKSQRQYFSLRLRGMSRLEAVERSESKGKTLRDTWEMKDPKFVEADRYLMANADRYGEQALTCFVGNLNAKVQTIIDDLVNKGVEKWSELDRKDRECVMQAVNLIAKRGTGNHRDEGDSYEEVILKKHTKIK